MALLAFREKPRSDARETLEFFRSEGVRLKIISGDDPWTVAAIARRVGLDVLQGFDARALPEDPLQLEEVMEANVVFGRLTPAQKREMVEALQRRGHTVAMTGDGVNDALALKAADLGIAMDSASPATKAVARLVLLDGRFDRLPAFFLALMPNPRRYQPGFLRRSLWFSVPAGLIVTASLFTLNAFGPLAGPATPEQVSSASVVTLSLVGLWILSAVCRPLNAGRLAVVVAMSASLLVLLNLPLAQDFFLLSRPPNGLLLAAVTCGVGQGPGVEVMTRVHARVFPTAEVVPAGP